MDERYSRQEGIIPSNIISNYEATVVGVGAIGRNVCLQLTAIGMPKLSIVDFDTVEISNLASQGFLEEDLGKPKVEAVANICRKINSNIKIDTYLERFNRKINIGNVVFCCVDSIKTRGFVWDLVHNETNLFIDGRMSAEVLRVLSINNESSKKYYPSTLFAPEETYQGSCTAKSTIYCANIAAGYLVSSLTKHIRGLPIARDLIVNLLSNEIIPVDSAAA